MYKTDRIGLAKTMTIGAVGGLIQDIYVQEYQTNVAIGGSLRIGSGNVQILMILKLYKY